MPENPQPAATYVGAVDEASVEWEEALPGGSRFVVGCRREGEWQFFDRNSWDTVKYPTASTPELIAEAELILAEGSGYLAEQDDIDETWELVDCLEYILKNHLRPAALQ